MNSINFEVLRRNTYGFRFFTMPNGAPNILLIKGSIRTKLNYVPIYIKFNSIRWEWLSLNLSGEN